MKLVTSYRNPDLDGVGCMYAYSEICSGTPGIFGTPQREAEFVLKHLKIKIGDAAPLADEAEDIVLLDTTKRIDGLPKGKVTEIIDHRRQTELENYPNAKAQIEEVGACATLIAERSEKFSKKAAFLLYTAIVSNTIDFQASVTTKRDVSAAEKMNKTARVSKRFLQEMFAYKSEFTASLKAMLERDFAEYESIGLGIAQLEILGSDRILKTSKKVIDTLASIKKERKLRYVFLNCIDIGKAQNLIVAADAETEALLRGLRLNFEKGIARTSTIALRKELVPKIMVILLR